MLNRIRSIRKRWFVAAAVVALLSVGLIGGAVFAGGGPAHAIGKAWHQNDGDDWRHAGKGHGGNVLARVAEIVGVEPDTLEGAFKTAWDEQADAKFDARIDALVADETLTEEQGDAAKTWFDGRPTQSGAVAIRLASTSDTDRVDSWLSKLVNAGRLTQDEADALSAWHAERPESLPESVKRHRGEHSGKGHGHPDGDHSDKQADGDDDDDDGA